MLKLVVDNAEKVKEEKSRLKTCREDCFLYNSELDCCPIFKGVELDDPLVAYRCQEFQDKDWWTDDTLDGNLDIDSSYEEEIMQLLQLEEEQSENGFDFLVSGERFSDKGNYPNEPGLPLSNYIENLHWYVSPEGDFGCWILNESKNKLMNVQVDVSTVQKGWAEKVYRSPVPLHDHDSTNALNSRVCWYVDYDGWGQYGLIVGNKVAFLTNPRPANWPRYLK